MIEVNAGHEWEEIVSLARRLDQDVASRQGIDIAGALCLAQAVVAFQRRVNSESLITSEGDQSGDGGGDHKSG
jgi:hypothetical protein